jgi:hypothetical protein
VIQNPLPHYESREFIIINNIIRLFNDAVSADRGLINE